MLTDNHKMFLDTLVQENSCPEWNDLQLVLLMHALEPQLGEDELIEVINEASDYLVDRLLGWMLLEGSIEVTSLDEEGDPNWAITERGKQRYIEMGGIL